jgi:thymidylate synthase (FAD)
LKWSVLAWKLRQQEILRGKSSVTEVSAFQEFSQRYADPTKDLEFVLREARLQDPKNRQNSIEVVQDNPEARRLAQDWERAQTRVKLAAIEAYNWAINNGIAKEQARAVLPEGMMSKPTCT